MKPRIAGWIGWAGLSIYVLLWDAHPRTETLSSAFAPHGTHGRRHAVLLWLYATAHLLRVIPPRYDPLRRVPLPWKQVVVVSVPPPPLEFA